MVVRLTMVKTSEHLAAPSQPNFLVSVVHKHRVGIGHVNGQPGRSSVNVPEYRIIRSNQFPKPWDVDSIAMASDYPYHPARVWLTGHPLPSGCHFNDLSVVLWVKEYRDGVTRITKIVDVVVLKVVDEGLYGHPPLVF